jgi:ABC-type nitrate/sulfonate/bicarbonate transport system permease component
LVPPAFLPSPVEVANRFGELLTGSFAGSSLLEHTASSLQRWGIGVLAGAAVGIPLGVVLAWFPPVRAAVTPTFELLRYIPPFAWVPIAVLWLGASTAAQALVVFVAAFPACVINSQLGVSQADPILSNAARTLGAGSWQTLRRVVLPVAGPSIYAGVRIAVSNGWMALVGAELIVGKEGLGFLIAQGQFNGSVSTIFTGIVAIGLVGTGIDLLIERSQRVVLPWRTPGTGVQS